VQDIGGLTAEICLPRALYLKDLLINLALERAIMKSRSGKSDYEIKLWKE
jgi:hypothetical protein